MKSSLGRVDLVAATVESLQADVYCSINPTGTPPAFALTAVGSYPSVSTTWTAGAWADTYGVDGWTVARTPTLGVAGSIALAAGDRRWLFVKVAVGSETAVWLVGTVTAS